MKIDPKDIYFLTEDTQDNLMLSWVAKNIEHDRYDSKAYRVVDDFWLVKLWFFDKISADYFNFRFPNPNLYDCDLNLKSSNLELSPPNMSVSGFLDLASSDRLLGFRGTLTVHGHLNLAYCSKLIMLPANTWISGDLILKDVPLKSLPENIHVGGDIFILNDKTNIKIPQSAKIAGTVYR